MFNVGDKLKLKTNQELIDLKLSPFMLGELETHVRSREGIEVVKIPLRPWVGYLSDGTTQHNFGQSIMIGPCALDEYPSCAFRIISNVRRQ